MDNITGEQITVASDDLNFTDDAIQLYDTGLETNWHYVVIVEANNTGGTANSSTAISKFLLAVVCYILESVHYHYVCMRAKFTPCLVYH